MKPILFILALAFLVLFAANFLRFLRMTADASQHSALAQEIVASEAENIQTGVESINPCPARLKRK